MTHYETYRHLARQQCRFPGEAQLAAATQENGDAGTGEASECALDTPKEL